MGGGRVSHQKKIDVLVFIGTLRILSRYFRKSIHPSPSWGQVGKKSDKILKMGDTCILKT